jgi:DtxR family Mn-dependent transcriptional regulator
MEDYLEAVLRLERRRGLVRGKELAAHLSVTTASISSIMPKLGKLGLVEYERYAPIRLTPLGRRLARKILRREEVLAEFFQEVLGVPKNRAREEACRIEHDISPRSLKRLEAFLAFLKAQPGVLERWVEPPLQGNDTARNDSTDSLRGEREPSCTTE